MYLKVNKLGMVVHICNPNTWEAEAGRLQVQGHPQIHSETPFQKTKMSWLNMEDITTKSK
jgi:hypothetical protein